MTDGPPARPRSRQRTPDQPAGPLTPSAVRGDSPHAGGTRPSTTISGNKAEDSFPIAMTLFPGEDKAQAAQIAGYLLQEIRPRPGIERMMTESIINHTREIVTLEKVRARVARLELVKTIKSLIEIDYYSGNAFNEGITASELCALFEAGSTTARTEVINQLASKGLTMPAVEQTAYAKSTKELANVSELIARAEHRRDKLVRTLQGNRAMDAALAIRALQGQHLEMRIAQQRITSAADTDHGS